MRGAARLRAGSRMSGTGIHVVTVDWGDCDPAQIVFYPNYFAWFDAATHRFFREAGLAMDGLEARFGVIFPLTEASARFLRPSGYGDAIELRTTVAEWKPKGLVLAHQGWRDGALLIEGRESRVCVAREPGGKLQAVEVPAEVRQALAG